MKGTVSTRLGAVIILIVTAVSGLATGWVINQRLTQVAESLQDQITAVRQEIQTSKQAPVPKPPPQ